jgi:sortase (surface protein transpeptidase)
MLFIICYTQYFCGWVDKLKKNSIFVKNRIMEKHEQLRNEILNNDNIPQDLKDRMNNLKTEFETKWSEEDKWINDNIKEGRKVIGYDNETFLPIFEK